VEVLKKLFETWMHEKAPPYLPMTRGWDDKSKEKAIEKFAEKEPREEFFRFFRNLQNLYDILSTDAFLRPFMDDYQALAELYALIRNAYADRPYADKEFAGKTRDLLRLHTVSSKLELPGAIQELGPKELAALKDSEVSDRAKVLNLPKILVRTVDQEGAAKPFVVSIGERAEALAMLYEDRQLTTQQALLAFEKLAQEVVEADRQWQELGVDENTIALYISLKPLARISMRIRLAISTRCTRGFPISFGTNSRRRPYERNFTKNFGRWLDHPS
jgi:type I restriction enzyme R subunit